MTSKIIFAGINIGNISDIPNKTLHAIKSSNLIITESINQVKDYFKNEKLFENKIILEWPCLNEENVFETIKTYIEKNENVIYLAGEGMPGITDPGTKIVRYAINNKIKYTAIPGPSIVSTLPILSGLCCEGFVFERFIPINKEERLMLFKKLNSFDKPFMSLIIEHKNINNIIIEIIDDIISIFSINAEICIGIDVSMDTELIISDNIVRVKEILIEKPIVDNSKVSIFVVPESRLNSNCL